MLPVADVAGYFLQKDTDGSMFNLGLLEERNGTRFYVGNARLNKYLHLAHNIYIAKTGSPLINADFYAYDNGAVVLDVQRNYSAMVKQRDDLKPKVPDAERDFLDRFWEAFRNADVDELIDLSHEDDEWAEKNKRTGRHSQKMDQTGRVDEYKEQYGAIVAVLDRLAI
jgi:uncharacterized phage-associated protein